MTRTKTKPKDFRSKDLVAVSQDRWKNDFVRCPACKDIFKRSGVRIHFYLAVRNMDKVHTEYGKCVV